MTTVYITRHGQTVWNVEGRLQGQKNSELTEKGVKQAGLLGKRMEKVQIDRIYASPLKRTVETAKIIRGKKNIEIVEEDGFKELNFGDYEGRREIELDNEGKSYELDRIFACEEKAKAPNGETLEELYNRVSKALDKILSKEKGKSILIVTHGMALRAVFKYFSEDKKFYDGIMGQATLTKVVDNGDGFKFEYVNNDEHLKVHML